jgi:ABC-type polysaccharide/polyol phosphate transport system ATPase subunit
LKDVSFEVKKGEALGIVGLNGAGKSTLLKVLAGVTPPTRGMVEVGGRISPMIELNAGIHHELTGRENAFLLGAIMGFTGQRIQAQMPEIEEFCDLGEWFDRPVRMYSAGMLARLGFAVAVIVDSEILLIDEVLGVGDFSFQKKCVSRLIRASNQGTSLLLVSHNPYLIERMCDRVILLHEGKIEELGESAEVIPKYFSLEAERKIIPLDGGRQPGDMRPGTGEVRIQKVETLNDLGEATTEVFTGDPLTIRLHYKTTERVSEPNFGVRVLDQQNTIVVSFESTAVRKVFDLHGEGYIDCKVPSLPIMPNVYTIQIKVVGHVLFDMYEDAAKLTVIARSEASMSSGNKGIAYAKAYWDQGE